MALEDSDPTIPPRPLPETTKSDEGKQVIGVDDLVVRERRRLGDYIALQTQKVYKNQYPISGDSTIFKSKTDTGNPAPISDQDTNAVNTYMKDVARTDNGQKAVSTFESTSESGLLDTDTPFKIKKGKSDSDLKTGNEYLREIDQVGGEAEIPKRIQRVMLDNNRFAESNPAFVPGQREGQGNSIGSLIVQPKLGQHSPGRFPKKADGDGGNYISVSVEKLKNFGLTTMLQASGEINVPTDLSDPAQVIGAGGGTLVPGLARLGQRVPVTRFDSVKILNELEPTYSKNLRDSQLQGNAILSYGNVNSALVPFSGLLSAGSVTGAAVLALAATTMLQALYVTIYGMTEAQRLLAGVSTEATSLSQSRKLRLGNFFGKDNENAIYRSYDETNVVDLVKTNFDYHDCVNKGIIVFFGVDRTNNNSSVELSAGWYNTVARNLLKSAGALAVGISLDRQSYDVDPSLAVPGNAESGALLSATNYIKQINNSPILKFMNIIALIGEASLTEEKVFGMDDINDVSTAPLRGDENGIAPKLGVLHAKSRLSDTFGGKLAWSGNTVRSMYLLPSEIKTAAQRLDGDTSRFGTLLPSKGFRESDAGRLSPDDVERMEDYLEADYLPFYFHDLRTNEIVSFHAFLDNISDNYTVDYTENEGYGRVGKVLTYKNTNRSISLGFSVLATSPDDFDDMWLKINKLITLLYPQYTQGRELNFGVDRFTQPFSQLPAASPLVRLRLGDIFKSNYNRFNLARLFGLATPGFSLETATDRERAARNSEHEASLTDAREEISARMRSGHYEVGDKLILIPSEHRLHRYIRDDSTVTHETLLETITQKDVTVVSVGDEVTELAERKIHFQVDNAEGDEVGTWHASARHFLFFVSEIERQAQQRAGETPTVSDGNAANEERQAIQDFFQPSGEDANPIFKSFESVRGRGLAGFIRSLNMDIDQSFTWETTGLNNRAPKLLKISMQFDPIHDLQPGIDHNGFNTAPVYNVGQHMKQINKTNQADTEARDAAYKNATNIAPIRRRRTEPV